MRVLIDVFASRLHSGSRIRVWEAEVFGFCEQQMEINFISKSS